MSEIPIGTPGNGVYIGDRWLTVLDATVGPSGVRVRVERMATVHALHGVAFDRRLNPAQLVGYTFQVGLRSVVRKIRGRLAERNSHRKALSIGDGVVVHSADPALEPGTRVIFIAPRHALAAERVVVDRALVRPTSDASPPRSTLQTARVRAPVPAVERMAGWSPWSGKAPPEPSAALDQVADALSRTHGWQEHPHRDRPVACTVTGRPRGSKPRLSVFGWGQYARVVAWPSLARHLQLSMIHEIDPARLIEGVPEGVGHTTAPELLPDEPADAVLAAGFHHTHAPLACQALQAGLPIILEKPPATTLAQLQRLLRAMERPGARVFLGYNRRFLEFNEMARRDLGVQLGAPIDYHAVVYEEPLPASHWYRWPASGGRIISNGCHWIDHFLFLNDFSPLRDLHVARPRSVNHMGTVTLALDNGAAFSMTLTDRGSGRVGMRERIELRAGRRTAYIEDQRSYAAENPHRLLRRLRRPKLHGYHAMYRHFGELICAGAPGEHQTRLARSTQAVLDVAEAWERS